MNEINPSESQVKSAAPAVDNNFNLLRLLFALMVAAYHAVLLPGIATWAEAVRWLTPAAEVGVQGFFVLSGFLVYSSLIRSPTLKLYAEKRVRRLYPAYASVVIVCALAALAFVQQARESLADVARYLGWNLVFLNFMAPGIPGVFASNPLTEINGALWTLKIEVMFYIILPILALLLRVNWLRWPLIVAIYVAAEAWRIGFRLAGQGDASLIYNELYAQLPGQMSFFITGIGFAILNLRGGPLHIAGAIGAVLFGLSLILPAAEPVRAIGLGAVSIWAATGLPRLFDAARFGDLSYGIYIVHFPMVQAAIALGVFNANPALGLAISAASALFAALALWHLVERPALRSDSAYRNH